MGEYQPVARFATHFSKSVSTLFLHSSSLRVTATASPVSSSHRHAVSLRRIVAKSCFSRENEGPQYSNSFRQGRRRSSRGRLCGRCLVVPLDSTWNVSFSFNSLATALSLSRGRWTTANNLELAGRERVAVLWAFRRVRRCYFRPDICEDATGA